jgi:DNA helicase-2/ATP-dependent DNA helicase PcrA
MVTKLNDSPRLSYTSIHTYEQCPLQYKYRYLDRLEWEAKPALSFGESLHEALEWFYSAKTPHPPELPSLLAKLAEVWVGDGYEGEEEEQRYLEHAREVLTTFYHANAAKFRMPVAVEQRFELDLEDFVLTGKIDRMDRHADGTYEILDYKTNRKLPPRNRLASDLQLPIYQYAASSIWGVTPGKLTLYYLLPNQRFSTRPWGDERLAGMLERLRGVARSIRTGAFDPIPNVLCPWCDFKNLCPVAPGAEMGLARLVDRYADLERRRINLEGLLGETAAELDRVWPEGESAVHSKRNCLRRREGDEGAPFQLEP